MKNAREKMLRATPAAIHNRMSPGATQTANAAPTKNPKAKTKTCSMWYLVMVRLPEER